MFEAMKEQIKKDNAFVYNLSKPYDQYSQIELANEVWMHKGPEDIKVVINHNGKKYELYTIDCNSAQDFLNKYHLVLDEIGISYNVIPKVQEENDDDLIYSQANNVEDMVSNVESNNDDTIPNSAVDSFEQQNVNIENNNSEYSDAKDEELSFPTQVSKDEEKLLKYKDRLEYCQSKLEELNEYELGNIRTKGGNFDNQIAKLTKEIEELKSKLSKSEDMEQISSDLSNIYTVVNDAIANKILNEIEKKASKSFLDAYNFPTTENILLALDSAQKLDDNSKLKINLMDGITRLTRRYSSTLDEEEIVFIKMRLDSIGISLEPNLHLNENIQNKEDEINKLKTIKENRLNTGKPIKENIINEIEQLKIKIQELEKQLGRPNEVVEEEKKEESTREEESSWKNSKLNGITKEGSIFTDTSRIDNEHSYLNAANAKNLGYVNDWKNVNQAEVTEEESNNISDDVNSEVVTTSVDMPDIENSNDSTELALVGIEQKDLVVDDEDILEYDFTDIEKDSLFNFTIVENVKKVSKNLYEKISNINFKEKVKEAVEILKENVKPKIQVFLKEYVKPIAVTSGLALGAAAAIASVSPKVDNSREETKTEVSVENNQEMIALENDIQNTLQQNNNSILVSFDNTKEENIDNETQFTPIFEEESQKAVDETLTGENTVYTNIYDAAQGANGIDTDKLYSPSWENGTPVNYYVIDNGTPEIATKEEAMEKYNSGESIIQSVENDGTTIGFVEFNNGQEQSSGMVK